MSMWYVRAANHAGKPRNRTTGVDTTALCLPMSTKTPRVLYRNGRAWPCPSADCDVVSHEAALAQRVLSRRRCRACALRRRVGHGGGVADRPDVLVALDPQRRLDLDPAARTERETELADERRRRHPGRPDEGPRRDSLARRERRRVLLDRFELRAGADLDPAAAQLGGREVGELGADLGHDAVERLDEDPARPVDPAARIAVDHVRDHVLELGDPLDAGVARADEDERQVLAPPLRVVERLGDLEVEQHAVAQRDRLGEGLESDPVLGEARNRQRARDGPEGEHELVVAGVRLAAVERAPAELVQRRVEAEQAPELDVGPVELLTQRNDDVARLERAGSGAREERRVEEEVCVAHDRDARAVAREDALEPASGVEPAEPAAGNDDVPGHG